VPLVNKSLARNPFRQGFLPRIATIDFYIHCTIIMLDVFCRYFKVMTENISEKFVRQATIKNIIFIAFHIRLSC